MAYSFNKVIMIGRIVNEIELKTTSNGINTCSFRIAVDRRFQTRGEEKKTDFFNVVAWRRDAEFVSRFLAKGRMILVEGELQTRQYTDKNGNPNTWYEISADRVGFADSVPQGGQGGYSAEYTPPQGYAAPAPSAPAQAASPAPDFAAADPDDDYPF